MGRFLAAGVIVCLLLVLAATASAGDPLGSKPPQTYRDELGDSGRAADLETVTVSNAATGNLVDFSIRKSDLGGVRHFDFFVVSYRDDRIDDRDDGPSGGSGMWHYDFREGFRLLDAGSFITVPKAGGTWSVGIREERSDNGAAVSSGKVHCIGSAGTLVLRMTRSGFTSRGGKPYAYCEFAIPRALKGKWVGARVDVTANGATASKILTSTAK